MRTRRNDRGPATHVLWLFASNTPDFERSVITISKVLNLTGGEIAEEQLLARFEAWLLDPANGKWLIVIDGFDFVKQSLDATRGKLLLESIPVVTHGSTLLTLR